MPGGRAIKPGDILTTLSGKTLEVDYPKKDFVQGIRDNSRKSYALPKKEVETILKKWDEGGGAEATFDSMTVSQDFVEPIIDL